MSIMYKGKSMLRHVLNNTLGSMHVRCKPAKNNILIFSTRRSGSTWLVQLLSTEPATKRIMEPYDVYWNYNYYKKYLPQNKEGFFFSLNDVEREKIFKFYDDLVSGKKTIRTQWKVWREGYYFKYNRLIFKLFYVKNYMQDFERRYPVSIIYLVRHPIASAMSNIRLNWATPINAFFGDQRFCKEQLNNQQKSIVEEIINAGTVLERYTAGWFLENIDSLRMASESNWLVLKYEDMVREPEKTVDILCDRLDLGNRSKMLEMYNRPSWNTFDSVAKIETGKSDVIADSWRKQYDPSQHQYMEDLFKAFDNTYYSLGSFSG